MPSAMIDPAESVQPPLEARDLEKTFEGGDGRQIDVLRGVTN